MIPVERVLCLDVGDKRIGLAVSDPLGFTAQPVETYVRRGYGPDTRHILDQMAQLGATRLLLGLPRNMDGSEGFQAQKVRDFGQQLLDKGVFPEYYDERLTTKAAHDALSLVGRRHRDHRAVVDQVAAQLILQAFLDAGGAKAAPSTIAIKQSEDKIMTDDRNNGVSGEEMDNIVELIDEDGQTVVFEHLMTLPYGDAEYVILTMAEDTPDTDEGEVFILRIEQDDQGEDSYVTVEDEAVEQAVFDLFMEQVEDLDAEGDPQGGEV